MSSHESPDSAPPAHKGLLALAALLLAVPIVALMWVGSYSRIDPKLGAFPFFIWYQFVWVVLCSAMTYTAYRLVKKARPHRPIVEDPAADAEPGEER